MAQCDVVTKRKFFQKRLRFLTFLPKRKKLFLIVKYNYSVVVFARYGVFYLYKQ